MKRKQGQQRQVKEEQTATEAFAQNLERMQREQATIEAFVLNRMPDTRTRLRQQATRTQLQILSEVWELNGVSTDEQYRINVIARWVRESPLVGVTIQ